jgi:hypothetical protein
MSLAMYATPMNDDLGAFGTDTYDQDSTSKLEDTENGSEYNGGSRELCLD